MILNNEQVYFAAIPTEILKAAAKIKNQELRETLFDILMELSKHNKKENDGEWHFHDEGFYPLTWASKRLGKDEHTIRRRLSELVKRNMLTVTKEKKGYKVNDDKYFRETTYIKLKPVSQWGNKGTLKSNSIVTPLAVPYRGLYYIRLI